MATKAKGTKATKTTAPAGADAREFAVIQTGGKQYMVAAGDTITIEKLGDTHKVGDKITFGEVLLSDNGKDATTIGAPFIDGATVEGEITKIGRGKKITVIKYKAKSNYFKKRGHRQPFFQVKITKVA